MKYCQWEAEYNISRGCRAEKESKRVSKIRKHKSFYWLFLCETPVNGRPFSLKCWHKTAAFCAVCKTWREKSALFTTHNAIVRLVEAVEKAAKTENYFVEKLSKVWIFKTCLRTCNIINIVKTYLTNHKTNFSMHKSKQEKIHIKLKLPLSTKFLKYLNRPCVKFISINKKNTFTTFKLKVMQTKFWIKIILFSKLCRLKKIN